MHTEREERRGGTAGRLWSSRGAQQGVARCTLAGLWLDSNLFVTLPLDFSRRHTLGTSPYAFATHGAVVEVSQETGAIRVLQYVAVHDAGRIMNPLLAAGQVHGAIAQGIGQALLEGMVYSPEGQPLTGTLLDYTVPRASTTPTLTL